MRNYRHIGSNKSYLMGLGSGASQISKKRIRIIEKLTRMKDQVIILLKGRFIFEDTTFTYIDTLIIRVSSGSTGKITISENISPNDYLSLSVHTNSDEMNEQLNNIMDTLIIIKE